MKNTILISVLTVMSSVHAGSGAPPWGYSGDAGPENWGKLSSDYASCNGKNQSPINITNAIEADLKPLRFDYKAGGNEILNNGHTIQVNYTEGSSITLDNVTFNLKQFHFHAPSENQINGKSYPLEVHLVHADKDGNLAVIGVMFTEGKENKGLAKAWAKMPEDAGDQNNLKAPVLADSLLPFNRDYYRFSGSLTTPPCSEGVRWLVMKEMISASRKQIEEFMHAVHHENNRPIQAVNARAVLQ